MRPLRPGEATLLSWRGGAVQCRVVAAAGSYVLLRPARTTLAPVGSCTLATLDGEPAGWDGEVELALHPHELRFRHRLHLAVGDLVRVRCALPDGILVDADAVVRSAEAGIGAVEFTTMHGTDAATIGAWTVEVLRGSMRGTG